ncbi:MAG TPA: DNA starvation/stationary phase protection protein Dps [Kofleriaceae bacterium]|jgi:starvation-inducible DNA-binding protein
MYKTPSHLPEAGRNELVRTLNARLVDGLDLHGDLKVAHWNVRGLQFPALHPLFEQIATELAAHNDAIAERAVTLGGLAVGTSRHVARTSRLADYPLDVTRDSQHVQLLADRLDTYLEGLRESRGAAETQADTDTVDLLTGTISAFEKHAWFLRATLA